MTENDPSARKPIEIVSDEDWKTRVKAEDAKRDAEAAGSKSENVPEAAQAEASKAQPEATDEQLDWDQELPPASFQGLVQMLSSQAVVALGMIPTPEGKSITHLPLAKHFIDLLSILEKTTQGNLSTEEANLLDQSLHELRMAFLEVSRARAT